MTVLPRPAGRASIHDDVTLDGAYCWQADIEASAHKLGVPDEDMLHALRHHWRAFETDDPAVTLLIGPGRGGRPLEIGVVADEAGTAVIDAMSARGKFMRGWWTP